MHNPLILLVLVFVFDLHEFDEFVVHPGFGVWLC